MPYQESPYFETPPRTKFLWRYMTVDKFMAMLSEEALYFPNIYLYKDKYEGRLSSRSRLHAYMTKPLFNENTPIKQDEAFQKTKRMMEEYPDVPEKNQMSSRDHSFHTLLTDFSSHLMFCNSWFLRYDESNTMWAEYGDNAHPTSVAIQTTVGDLIDSLESTEYNIHIGKVKYINYRREHIEGYEDLFSLRDLTNPDTILELFYAPIMHKRDVYDGEHEVRAVISFESICEKYLDRVYTSEIPFYSDILFKTDISDADHDKTNLMKDIPKGIPVRTNLKTLIKWVVTSPNAKKYYLKPLRELMENHNLLGAVSPSDI